MYYRLDWGRTEQSYFDDFAYLTSFFPRRKEAVEVQLEISDSGYYYTSSSQGTSSSKGAPWIVLLCSGVAVTVTIGAIAQWRRNKIQKYAPIK
jgi:hypothetical protein